jgi:hypothetical protein
LLQNLLRRLGAELRQRVQRRRHLSLNQAAHLEHAVGNAAEFGVELRGQVFVVHAGLPFA